MKNKKGFTLIELLVSVALVGILAAMAIANFSEYRKKAFDAGSRRIAADMHTVAEAWASTDWDQVTDQNNTWFRKGDGSETFQGNGAEFKQFYSAPSSDYSFIARIDTGCYLGASCDNGIVKYGFAAHCLSPEGGLVRRYILIEREGGATEWEESNYAVATYCP